MKSSASGLPFELWFKCLHTGPSWVCSLLPKFAFPDSFPFPLCVVSELIKVTFWNLHFHCSSVVEPTNLLPNSRNHHNLQKNEDVDHFKKQLSNPRSNFQETLRHRRQHIWHHRWHCFCLLVYLCISFFWTPFFPEKLHFYCSSVVEPTNLLSNSRIHYKLLKTQVIC